MKLSTVVSAALTAVVALAQRPQIVNSGQSWMRHHMKSEHLIDDFDALSFFTLHDSDNSKTWTSNDILNLYGLLRDRVVGDGSGMGKYSQTEEIPQETKDFVLKTVLDMIDLDKDGIISLEEWRIFTDKGGELPDFGLGPGHHADFEAEYEIHHWQEMHAENDPDVKVKHKEDIEHDLLYHNDHGDDPESHGTLPVGSWIKMENVPSKFIKKQ